MTSVKKKLTPLNKKHPTHKETILKFSALVAILIGYYKLLSGLDIEIPKG